MIVALCLRFVKRFARIYKSRLVGYTLRMHILSCVWRRGTRVWTHS